MPKGRIKITKEDKEWANQVKERDGECVICGEKEKLNAHHIIPREIHETKLDINNGISLCPKHHIFSRIISAHNNPLGFFIWLIKNRPDQLDYLVDKMKEMFNDSFG